MNCNGDDDGSGLLGICGPTREVLCAVLYRVSQASRDEEGLGFRV